MAFQTKPFFIPQKEIDLFDVLNSELIDHILNQYVDVYKVSFEETEDNVYGESSKKYFKKGFRVNCLIAFEEPTMTMEDLGSDLSANIEIYFHRTTLAESKFYPEVGDIIDWNDFYFEAGSVVEPQLIGGNPNFSHEIKVLAHRMRLSNLQIEERPR